MDKVYLNKEISRQLHDMGKYIPKHCYDNIFDNISIIGSKFKEEEIKIMFCYVSIVGIEGLYTRHACYYLDGMAIDPTIVSVYRDDFKNSDIHYLPFKIMTVDEYFVLLAREHNTSLFRTFSTVEKIKQRELVEHGITLIG